MEISAEGKDRRLSKNNNSNLFNEVVSVCPGKPRANTLDKPEAPDRSQRSVTTQAVTWLENNITKPFTNTCIGNLQSLGGVLHYDRLRTLRPFEIREASFLSPEYFVQHLSSGLAATIPYAIAGKLTGGGLRAAVTKFKFTGMTERVLCSESTAQIAGAALWDGARVPDAGGSRVRNAIAGAAGFGMYEWGNARVRNFSLLNRLGGRMLTGAMGATVQQLITDGNLYDGQKYKEAIVSGAFMNMVLPTVQEYTAKPVDFVDQHILKRGIPVERFIEQNKLQEKAPDLSKEARDNRSYGVLINSKVNPSIDHENRIITIRNKADVDALRHELEHRGKLLQDEGRYRQAAQWLETDHSKAKEKFFSIRLESEISARSKHSSGSEISRQAILQIYQADWEKDFEKFKKSKGKFRPIIENSKEEDTGPTGTERFHIKNIDGKPLCDVEGRTLAEALEIAVKQHKQSFAYADLPGKDLRVTDLFRADFSGADLSRTDFEGAKLLWTKFSKSDLSGAKFMGAKLQGANFSGAKAPEADFSGALFEGTIFSRSNLMGANFFKADLRSSDLNNAHLLGADFSDAQMKSHDLEYAITRGAYSNLSLQSFLPPDLADSFKSTKAWKRIAAKLAWKKTIADYPDWENSYSNHIQQYKIKRSFEENFNNMCDLKRQGVLKQAKDLSSMVACFDDSTVSPIGSKALHASLYIWNRLQTEHGKPANPAEILDGLKFNALKTAIKADMPSYFTSEPNMAYAKVFDRESRTDHMRNKLALVLVFGEGWKKWIDTQKSLQRNSLEATSWLPIARQDQLQGLANYLIKNANKEIADLTLVAKDWIFLDKEQRDLSFDKLVRYLRASKYRHPFYEQKYRKAPDAMGLFEIDDVWFKESN